MDFYKDRIITAIEFLKNGIPFKLGEVYLGIDEFNVLNITGSTRSIDLKSLNKASIIAELIDIKEIFRKMKAISEELEIFSKSKIIKFNLDFDYGMGDIRICSEKEGEINWEYEIKD